MESLVSLCLYVCFQVCLKKCSEFKGSHNFFFFFKATGVLSSYSGLEQITSGLLSYLGCNLFKKKKIMMRCETSVHVLEGRGKVKTVRVWRVEE